MLWVKMTNNCPVNVFLLNFPNLGPGGIVQLISTSGIGYRCSNPASV
jgi:hypothetical protein